MFTPLNSPQTISQERKLVFGVFTTFSHSQLASRFITSSAMCKVKRPFMYFVYTHLPTSPLVLRSRHASLLRGWHVLTTSTFQLILCATKRGRLELGPALGLALGVRSFLESCVGDESAQIGPPFSFFTARIGWRELEGVGTDFSQEAESWLEICFFPEITCLNYSNQTGHETVIPWKGTVDI